MKAFQCSGEIILAVAIFFLVQISQALPLPYPANRTVDSPTIVRRECVPRPSAPGRFDCDYDLPTLSQIVTRMRDGEHGGRVNTETSAFFYSNLGFQNYAIHSIVAWYNSQENVNNFYTAFNALDKSWYLAQLQWVIDHPDDMDIVNPRYWMNVCFTEALAAAALYPDVYLFTREDGEPHPDSFWIKVEFPALTLNKNIMRIYRVDPRPPQDRGLDPEDCKPAEAKLIWDRQRGDAEITNRKQCPFP